LLANLPSNQLATYVTHFNPQTGFSRILGAGVRGVWELSQKIIYVRGDPGFVHAN